MSHEVQTDLRIRRTHKFLQETMEDTRQGEHVIQVYLKKSANVRNQ